MSVKTVDVKLNPLAARQCSLVQHKQALEIGMTRRQLHDRVASGLRVPVHRGVYRMAGAPVPAEQSLFAACLAAGGDSVASHRCAATLWGLRGVEPKAPEITVPRTACPTLGSVVVHRTGRLDPTDVSRRSRASSSADSTASTGATAPRSSNVRVGAVTGMRFTWSAVHCRPAYVVDAVAGEPAVAWPA